MTGWTRGLASTTGTVFRLVPDSAGGLVFIDRTGDRARVYRTARSGTVTELARGPLTGIGLARGAGGRAFLTGAVSPTRAALPTSVRVSTHRVPARSPRPGMLALTRV